ncbi:MAG: Holliday junction branch migration protein RuvA [Bacillota bacterium]|nr:Holliday junction branch migration protein RuvA [Bacillota bacterium]
MYHYLKGLLVKKNISSIIVENNNIGYEVFTSMQTISELEENSEVKVYTRLIIKDEEMILIGFSSKLELEVFEMLKTVSGVGIKSALSILNSMSLNQLITCVLDEDFKTLTIAPGIGKKSAQRIIIELKDKFSKRYHDNIDNTMVIDSLVDDSSSNKRNDVKSALQSLGYSSGEIHNVIKQLDLEKTDIETLIKKGLKLLLKG